MLCGEEREMKMNVKVKSLIQICAIFLAAVVVEGRSEQLGMGSYTDSLAGRQDISTGKSLHDIEGTPKVSDQLSAPFPTTDWWSSLIWSFQDRNQFSENMHAHPLTLKTQSQGLDIGSPKSANIYSHEWQGTVLQRNSGYQFTHTKDFTIGLSGMNAVRTVADNYSDWAVTALWEDNVDKLRAIFGHGLPFVYFTKEGVKDAVVRFEENKQNHHFSPFNARTYILENISGSYVGGVTKFLTNLNAGDTAGLAAKVRISYDFNGDGEVNKVELYGNFATDASDVSWERYDENSRNGLDFQRSYGDFQNMDNGRVKFEIWKTEGDGSLAFESSQSFLKLPFTGTLSTGGVFYFDNEASTLTISAQAYEEVSLSGSSEAHDPSDVAKVWYHNGNTIAVTINNTHYAFFAPEGSQWQLTQTLSGSWIQGLQSSLAGKDYFSTAVLPNDRVEALMKYKKHAFAFVTDTKVSYDYDQENSEVSVQFTATTTLKENALGYENSTMLGLYRHQWLYSNDTLSDYVYNTARGEMKQFEGNQFSVTLPYHGVLPSIPMVVDNDHLIQQRLIEDVNEIKSRPAIFQKPDTYWRGKEYARVADLAQIADQLGENEMKQYLINALKTDITSWLTDSGQADTHFYYYNKKWGSMIGYPASFGSETQLNDHHFHFGYLVKAAATIAKYDPQWASQSRYGAMVNALIKDVANIDRDDAQFPWLRQYDPYAGHAWASGHGSFASGNNQESSSESMNFSTAVILWGEATQQMNLRDLGVFLYAMENQAINQYWFDVDNQVFPEDFGHTTSAIVWGDGGVYGTWWTANPEEIHGINFLPIHGGSLYLGQSPNYVSKSLQDLQSSNTFFEQAEGGIAQGQEASWDNWRGLLLQYMALSDADAALAKYNADSNFNPEDGTSHTQIRYWLENLAELGQVVTSIRANVSTYAVLVKEDVNHYIAYNPGDVKKIVTFTDGTSFMVPSKSYAIKSGESVLIQMPDDINNAVIEEPIGDDLLVDGPIVEEPIIEAPAIEDVPVVAEPIVEEEPNTMIIDPVVSEPPAVQSHTVYFTDEQSRFTGAVTVLDAKVIFVVDTDASRSYVILHYINADGVPQNVIMLSDGQGHWSWDAIKFDFGKPFHFTIQDSTVGQFGSVDYLYGELSGSVADVPIEETKDVPFESTDTPAEPEENELSNAMIADSEARFSGNVLNNQGVVTISLSTDASRGYVIVHYVDVRGVPQNVTMVTDGEGNWQWETSSIDLSQGLNFTIADPVIGQFDTERYFF